MHFMERRAGMRLVAALVVITTLAWPALETVASAPVSDDSDRSASSTPPGESTASSRIRFNFKHATFEQVIEFFSRETGLPVIWEADPPEGTLNYLSPEAYEMDDALRVLNIILQSRGVMLRVSNEMLYLKKLTDMQRTDVPTFVGAVPGEITDEQIVTVVRPLSNALAKPMAERLAHMVAQYGAVTAMEQQNSLVLTETAAQVRRLLRIIEELDRADPEGAVEIFKINHARAADLMEPLTALMSQRVERFIIDQRGQQQRIEEDEMAGLNISHDSRTNSIIARGTQARIDNLREAIALLDVPGTAGGRSIRTVSLAVLSPQDAASRLTEVYARLSEDERPAVLPMNEFGQVTIVGDERSIAEGVALLREIDGGDGDQVDTARRIAVTMLEHAEPGPLIEALQGLLNTRQIQMTRIVAGPDGRSVIIAGATNDVAAVEAVIPTLDRPARRDRTVRLLRLNAGGARDLVDRAKALYEEQRDEDDPASAITVEFDRESRTVTAIGINDAIDRFAEILRGLESAIVQRETRQVRTQHARPSELRATMHDLVDRMLAARGLSGDIAPTFDAFDDLDLLLVTATGEQLQSILPLIQSLDIPKDRSVPPLRILQLRIADAQNLAETLNRQYQQRPAEQRSAKPVNISADPQTNALIVAAHPDVLPEIQAIVDELNEDRRDYDGREIRIFPLKVARAEELARTIDEMFPDPPTPLDARGRPLPHLQQPREIVVRADRQTNSLIVDAPVQRMGGFEQLVEQLDRQQIMDATEVRTYPIRHAELGAVANTLRNLASAGSLSRVGQDRRAPITITTEPMSRTLIVAGPLDIFERVDNVLEELDARPTGPSTTLRFFRLEHARADSVADMLRNVLLTRIAEDVPDAGADVRSLLNVSADRKTNTVILSAPTALMPIAEELIRQLDDSTASLDDPMVRVHPLTFADARETAQSLQQAARTLVSKATGEPMDIRITAATGSNALILVGLEPDLKEVAALIEPLDARPAMDAIDATAFSLEHADAAAIAPIVQRLLAEQQETDPRIVIERIRRARGEVDLTPRIRVEADQRTNALIVSGTQQTVALAKTLIEQLDRADDSAAKTYQTFTPRNAQPEQLAQSVKRVLDSTQPAGRRSTLELIAEPQSGAIVVIGTTAEAARAMELLATLDDEVLLPPMMDLRIVRLEHSDAAILAPAITGLLRDQTRWPENLRAFARSGLTIGQPTVSADAANNRLLISAPEPLMPIAKRLLEEIDQPREPGGAVDVRIFHLAQARASDVASAVRGAMDAHAQDRPGTRRATIVAEPSSNAVIVTAAPSLMETIESIIQPLDRGMSADALQVRTVFLKYARAESVAPTVRQLLAGEEIPVWLRYDAIRQRRDIPDTGPDVRVAADRRLNAVIISAPAAVLNVAEEMVASLDVDPAAIDGTPARQVRVLTVRNADARELSANLQALFAEAEQTDVPPTIRVDAASNSLLVRATEAQFRTIEEVVEGIDRATIATSRQMQMIRIDPSKASADDVARTLQRMLDRSGGSTIEVIHVEDLLKRKRNGSDDEPRSMVPPATGPRWQAVQLVTFLGPAELPEDSEPDELLRALEEGSDITIAVDPETNSLIVIGSPRAVERLAELAREVQDHLPEAPTTIRYVALPDGADVGALARLVNQTLLQMTPAGGNRGDLARRTAVIPDPSAGAMIIAASDHDFETVGNLIAALSHSPTAEQLIVKVYPLQTVTADRAASSVRSLLSPDDGRRGRQAQRMRQLALTLQVEGREVEGVFDPNRVQVTADGHANALVVMGPPEAIAFVDQFIELLDQTPATTQTTLKLYPLRHARAPEMRNTLRSIYQSRFRMLQQRIGPGAIQPEFGIDDRTNTLIVTASPEHLSEIDELLRELDQPTGEDAFPLRIVELDSAQPGRAAQILQQVVIGPDQHRRATTMIVPDDNSGVLLIRAAADVNDEIDRVLKEIDRDAARDFEIRTIVLERANAASVASAIQRFYDDRARIASAARGRRDQARRVSIIGDEASRTLLIAASDRDFEQIQELVERFDSPQATGSLEFRVFELRHARATDISQTVQGLANDLMWNDPSMWFWPPQQSRQTDRDRGLLAIRADARLNALIVTGEGDRFAVVEPIIEMLDAPAAEHAQRIIELYPVRNAQLNLVEAVLRETFIRERQWWQPADPSDVRIRADQQNNLLIIAASAAEHERIGELIEQIDSEVAPTDHDMKVLALEFAQAAEAAATLRQFLHDRARATNAPAPTATILASPSANSLIVSASQEDMLTVQDLLARLDQPDVTGDRAIEIVALQEGQSQEIARIVREQFPRRAGQGVIVTPDVRTNSLIINAPQRLLAETKALIDQLDTRGATDETVIRTYALEAARAVDAQRLLAETLKLDPRGRTSGISIRLEDADGPAVEVKATIVADRRSNSLIVTATPESFPVIESLIRRIDDVPSVSQIEYRIIPLEHVLADDVSFTLRQMARSFPGDDPQPRIDHNRFENQLIIAATPDQFEQITRILREIDQPSRRQRVTDFVPLQFAEAQKIQEALSMFYGPFAIEADTPAKRNVRIVADPATNSLVISAEKDEWEGIRALLSELDSEEYDASLQLRVLPLTYADARSVARAINEAFQGTIERQRLTDQRRQRRPGDGDPREQDAPSLLVEAEEWVRAAAEPLTNSVIVSASRQTILKIEQIVEQLDVADYAKLPAPRIIPVDVGDPRQLAESILRLYEQAGDRSGKGLRIVGDVSANAIIVRADDEEFQQISALAEALQQQAGEQGVSVRVLRLAAAPAPRVASAIREAFQAKARQTNQPLSIQIDPQGNSLVIASTGALFREIEQTVEQLDAHSPGVGQGIFIIELENISPEAAKGVIESIGLHQPQRDDSVSRLVSEPITVSVLRGRNALIVVANPADRETIVGLLKAVDAEPGMAEATMRIVRLKNAQAAALAQLLTQVLRPADQQAETPLARAIQEQVRRLSVRRDGANEDDLTLDLTMPIRIIPDSALNAIVLSSTPGNVRAIEQLIGLFDRLPVTDAVTVQLFPLQNIAADQFARIVRDLFQQGKQLGQVPGAQIAGLPAGMVGKALLDEIAITTDERTNTVIVAGKEDAVALVEVLTRRLDSDIATGWVEPRILPLRYADAGDLARTLQAVLVEGATDLPQATPLQRQIGRLRMARQEIDGGRVLESDVFQPMTRLVIRPEPQLNALVLVGTPMNLELVTELVRMLDVEAASPSAAVRIYPIQHASAARLAQTMTRLFDQQVQSKAIRPEDRVIVQADDRTNALIVTTSARSFAVLESLLDSLDSEIAPDLREIRRIELEHASATRLAGLIQQMMDARLERLRRVQPETADLERATIVAEPRTNSLIIAAGNESYDVIRRLAEDLDRSTLGDLALVHVIYVPKGNLDRLAVAIDQIMERRYADQPAEIRASQRPLILTDPRTSSLLVAANPEDLHSIENLVERLSEAPVSPAVGLHVVNIEGTTRAEQLAPRLQRLMQERLQTLGEARTASDRVSIEADPASNSLIISANAENLEVIRGLIGMLVQAESEAGVGREVELFLLTSSRAADMVNLLNELHVREANRSRGQDTVRVTADTRLNAVLVNAPPSDVQTIRALVQRLDTTRPARIVETRFIPLQSANALETVNLIENVLSGRGIGQARASEQATVLRYVRQLARDQLGEDLIEELSTEMEVGAAIRESITLTPDVRTNTVIVSAPRDSMRMIEQMIRDLDASSVGSQNIRIFKLVNADAVAMAQILTDLFSLQRQGNLYVLRPRESAAPGPEVLSVDLPDMPPPTGLTGIELTAVPDERQLLSITVDSRTNSLLVSGTPGYLDLVESVITELDAQEANERELFVYPLRNAVAEEIARVVTEFVAREQEKLLSTLGVEQIGSAARLLEREITIVGDEKSNTVLVSASPRYVERVRQMIEQLDIDPPQVLIQVMLAEVTLDDTFDWGVDLQISGRIDGADVSAGYGLASAFVNGIGVPNLAIASSDFELLIRAMRSQGRLQVLSNPSVMAANNESARIQVGETLRLPSDVSITDTGRTITSVEPEEIGIILNVTPSINPDGFVRMEINPEISNLSARTTKISEDFEAPIITRRVAETTVTVFDGQTIVLGGLISDRFERRDRKVPILGDIPIIGALFRAEQQQSAKTELLIVLTPHVIESPAELHRIRQMTDREIDRLTVPPEVRDSIRRGLGRPQGDGAGKEIDQVAPNEQ